MTKRVFEIEWDDDNGPLWMNTSNLLLCLTHYCKNSKFTVRDVTGDGEANPDPESAGPLRGDGEVVESNKRYAIVPMFGRRKRCLVEMHGPALEEYMPEQRLWVERAEDEYAIPGMKIPFCVLRRDDWIRGAEL
jgi:hypothetical protein